VPVSTNDFSLVSICDTLVEAILPVLQNWLSAGESVEELLDAHPRLSREAILAALGFAAIIHNT